MKVLKAGIDFSAAVNINPTIGQHFLIKQSIATGWASLVKVTRVLSTQVEVEIINVIPTEESNKFGVKNGLKDRFNGFFKHWAFRKKVNIGTKHKFFKDSCVSVGSLNDWNPSILAKLI